MSHHSREPKFLWSWAHSRHQQALQPNWRWGHILCYCAAGWASGRADACGGSCPVHCRVLRSTLGLEAATTITPLPVLTITDSAQCPPRAGGEGVSSAQIHYCSNGAQRAHASLKTWSKTEKRGSEKAKILALFILKQSAGQSELVPYGLGCSRRPASRPPVVGGKHCRGLSGVVGAGHCCSFSSGFWEQLK